MTYAYDDYVQMPTKDLYDTAVMKMAIEAAKDMYDKGQAQMENFYKTYGDFMSPFARDMEWYGAAMNNVRQTVNDAYARGIDLFKSPEGRAIVAQLSHSIDPYRYNLARQNAKVGYEYLDAVKEAMRKGEYDEGFENFILNQEGGLGSFANFSSEGGRIWDRTAPSRFQDINQWTHHLFDNMELSYDPELSKKYPGYLAYSKSKDVMNTIVANNLATLAGTDLGKYMISRYEDQFKALGYSDSDATKAAVDILQKNIVNANWEQSQIKLQEDPIYKAQLAADLNKQVHEHNAAIDHRYKMLEEAVKSGQLTYDPETGKLYAPDGQGFEYSDVRQISSQQNAQDTIRERAGEFLRQMIEKEQADINAYEQAVKENKTGVRTTYGNTGTVASTPSITGGGTFGVQYTPSKTQTVTKHDDAEMAALKKRADAAKYAVWMYNGYFNKDGSVNIDKMTERGYFDENGYPTEMFMKQINKLNQANKYLSTQQRMQRADDTYAMYYGSNLLQGSEEQSAAFDVFAGTQEETVPGTNHKARRVNLSHYSLSAIHRGNVTGANVYDKDSDERRAQDWLRHNKVYGYVMDRDIGDATVPNKNGTSNMYDLYGDAYITGDALIQMFDKLNIRSKEKQAELLENLGIRAVNIDTNVQLKKGEAKYDVNTYYAVPITKSINSGIAMGDMNNVVRKKKYGASSSEKNQRMGYAAGIQTINTTR